MTNRMDLETAAELVADMVEQVGVGVDREALQDLLEELGEMDFDGLEW